MTRHNSLPIAIILLLLILSFFTFSTYSFEANIATAVQEEIFAGSEEIEILIYLQEQADTKKAALEIRQLMSERYEHEELKLATRKEVFKLLQDQARVKQRSILEKLEEKSRTGEVKEYTSFYVVNMIYARVEPQLIEKLARRPEVKHIYHNSKLVLDDLIETNFIDRQQTKSMPWNLHKIGAPEVWEKLDIDGTGVVFGFIDTGVAADHPALKNNWRGYDPVNPELDYNWFDPIYGRKYPDDVHGHGTKVTGIALGFDEESEEIVGVAPGANWIAVRGLNDSGAGSKKNLLTAGQYMLAPTDAEGNNPNPEMAPDIIVNAWGADWGQDDWFREMVNNWRNAYIFPVFAAGNDGPKEGSIYNPANYPESIAVGAIDQNEQLASFSSRGPGAYGTMIKPELVAPGVKIYSTTIDHYGSTSGTSMAAPHVAGVAALMLAGNPGMQVEDMEKVLKETAKPLTDSSYPDTPNYGFGYGMVNAFEAVAQVTETCALRIEVYGDGRTQPLPGIHYYPKGTSVTVTADAIPGWALDKWIVDGQDFSDQFVNVTMNQDKKIQAFFVEENDYKEWVEIEGPEDRVPVDERWLITFTRQFSVDEIDDIVITINNSFIPIDIEFKPEDNQAMITPVEPYLPGETYNLRIYLSNYNRYIMYFDTVQ